MNTIKLKKGFDLKLKGSVVTSQSPAETVEGKEYAIIPDDFHGTTPRLDKKEGEHVMAGESIYHDKVFESIKVTSPVSGTIKAINRGERRKILSIVIEKDASADVVTHDVKQPVKDTLLASGLWVMMRQRPYDIVPTPDVEPRDIFVTAFDSAPLATSMVEAAKPVLQYAPKGVEVLKSLTSGNVHISFKPGEEQEIAGAECHVIAGPHPAGNAGIQAANIAPVNKGDVVWTLDVLTLCRIGELFTTGKVNYTTHVAIAGECVESPAVVKTTMGCNLNDVLKSKLADDTSNCRIINGNVLTGVKTDMQGYLQYPYRQITVITEVGKKDEFMGWASLNPKRYSIYRTFTTWLAGKRGKECSMDARIKGGERAIVCLDEYDNMLPMDIYAEFLIKAIIAFDIDKMEKLGIYEVAPEDFALAEFADTSKIELQRIVREGLDRMRAEMS